VKNTTLEVIHYTEITKVNQHSNLSDTSTAVQHPPKDKEKEMPVAVEDSTIDVKRRISSDLIPVPEGSTVEGNYRGKGVWFPGTVMRAFEGLGVEGGRGNALYDIQYDDGEVERGMEAWYVRVKTPAAVDSARALATAPLALHTLPVSQASTAAPAAAVGPQRAVQSNLTPVSDSAVKGDNAAVLAKATASNHTDHATSVPASSGTEKKAIAAAATTATNTAPRVADDASVTASKAVANTAVTATVTANAAGAAGSVTNTVAATSSSQQSATTTAALAPGGAGFAQNKVCDKAEPTRATPAVAAPSAATVTVPGASAVIAPAAATVKAPSQTANGATAATANAVRGTSQAAVPASSASASLWAKTTPSPWSQKSEEVEGVKAPARPLSAAPTRALVIDTTHRRSSDPDPFDDSSESVDKSLKKELGLDSQAQGFSAQPVREQEGAHKQPIVQKDLAVKEVIKGVRGEVVPPLKLSAVMDEIKEGSLVEGNYAQIGEWFTGKITKKRSDGTYDILYDDGDVELGVRPPLVRLRR
jgi:hypothetical protein